jgi:hypothetical protein
MRDLQHDASPVTGIFIGAACAAVTEILSTVKASSMI